jgi:hypothetical protein
MRIQRLLCVSTIAILFGLVVWVAFGYVPH